MSDSETPSDPRFRIPRGSSDEEIDSDLASVASSDIPDDTLGADDDDASVSPAPRGKLLSDAPGLRNAISDATRALRTGLPSETTAKDDKHGNKLSDSDDDLDEDALASVTHAVTGRRGDNAALREVEPAAAEPSYPVTRASTGGGQADMMARMLNTLSGSGATSAPSVATLKKKVARLSASGKKPLAVPLPEPVAGRIERAAAYGQANDVVTEKWAGVVQKNRKAKALTFPMNGPGEVVRRNTTDVARGFKAANKYEKEIDMLLREAGVVNEQQVLDGEEQDELGVATISKDELLARRRELAKVRSLAFHYDQKMKRIKKIKSRKYRKMLKKEKEKLKEMGGGDDSDLEDSAIRAERRRAEERMSLRHKNTSKWVRRKLSRGEAKRNPETRAAIEEQLQLHHELKQRQEQEVSDSEDESKDSDSGDEEQTDEQLDGELADMRKEFEDDAARKPKPKKGLMGMRFMQAAEEKKRKAALALLNEMGGEGSGDESDAAEDREPFGRQKFTGVDAKKHGKQKTPGASEVAENGDLSDDDASVDGEDGEDAKALKQRIIREYEESAASQPGSTPAGAAAKLSATIMEATEAKAGFTTSLGGRLKADSSNPWLSGVTSRQEVTASLEEGLSADTPSRVKRKRRSREVAKAVGKQNPWLSQDKSDVREDGEKSSEPRAEEPSSEVNDAKAGGGTNKEAIECEERPQAGKKQKRVQFAVDTDDGGRRNQQSNQPEDGGRKAGVAHRSNTQLEEDNSGSDDDDDNGDLSRMSLVAKAFAGIGGADEADFQAAKAAEIEKSLPSAADLGAEVLPGWGKWDGAGMKKRKERKESAFARAARERLEAARSKAVSKRKDRNLSHVILDERRVKQAAELTLASVPFPFTSAQQWQRELETPVCKELMSGGAFSAGVQPRVRKKVGVAIEPLRHGVLQKAHKRRRVEKRIAEERERKEDAGAKKRRGKHGVIDLRKERAEKRSAARKGFLA